MVWTSATSTNTSAGTVAQHTRPAVTTVQLRQTASAGSLSLRTALENRGIPTDIVTICMQSWTEGTHAQYATYIKQWHAFTSERDINPTDSNELNLVTFLNSLVLRGLGYSTVNTSKSAVKNLWECHSGMTTSDSLLLSRFMKGVANVKPSTPRYREIWDPDIVLEFIRQLPDNTDLSLKMLTHKLAMLTALVSGQ